MGKRLRDFDNATQNEREQKRSKTAAMAKQAADNPPTKEGADWFAFLSQIESYDDGNYDLEFELIYPGSVNDYTGNENAINVNHTSQGVTLPIYFLRITNVSADTHVGSTTVRALLEPDSAAADTFWYRVRIGPESADNSIAGKFYDEEDDEEGGNDCYLLSCTCLSETEDGLLAEGPTNARILALLENLFYIPLAPVPASSSAANLLTTDTITWGGLGVMDVGAGGCNLLFDNTGKPICYFDVGKGNGAPDYLRSKPPSGVKKLAPILPNSADDLTIVLSHWDKDHWALAKSKNYRTYFQQLTWIVPDPAIHSSPTCAKFFGEFTKNKVQKLVTPFVNRPSSLGFACSLRLSSYNGSNKAAINNNKGAIAMDVILERSADELYRVFMPGDASFGNIEKHIQRTASSKKGWFLRYTVLLASHHGSDKFEAAEHIPQPDNLSKDSPNHYLIYSYGINFKKKTHYYNHPAKKAVEKYIAAGWEKASQYATAEGNSINGDNPTPDNRGNVWVGDTSLTSKIPLNTAFSDYEYQLPLP